MHNTWQYTGVAPFTDLVAWCSEFLPSGAWHYSWETFYFHEEKYFTMFLLKWL